MTVNWRDLAACAGADTEIFFPAGPADKFYREGKEYCRRCPVVNECLDFALASNSFHGLFGGLTAQERIVLAIQQGIKTRPYTDCGEMKGTVAGFYREKQLGIPHCDDCQNANNIAVAARKARVKTRR